MYLSVHVLSRMDVYMSLCVHTHTCVCVELNGWLLNAVKNLIKIKLRCSMFVYVCMCVSVSVHVQVLVCVWGWGCACMFYLTISSKHFYFILCIWYLMICGIQKTVASVDTDLPQFIWWAILLVNTECASLSSIPQGDWYCNYCQNTFEREKFVSHNVNAVVAGRISLIDPVDQITKRCIRIVKNIEAELSGCVLCRWTLSAMVNFCKALWLCHDFVV